MKKHLLFSLFAIIATSFFGFQAVAASTAVVKMKTDAPEGTALRFQTNPYDFELEGVDKGYYYGEYKSKGPGSEITLKCKDLTLLEAYGCQLTELEFVDAPLLSVVRCYDNKLTALDLAKCPFLEVLEAKNNKLTAVDLSANNIMETVDVSGNEITALKLGNQPKMTRLNCAANPLAALDLSQCPVLQDVFYQNCALPNVDFSKNPKLDWVFAFGNNMSGESMTKFIANLPEAATTGLIYIVNTPDDHDSNVCLMDDVRAFAAKGWATMDYLDGVETETQVGKFYPGKDYVPSVSDRAINLTTSRAVGEKITLNIKSDANVTISGVKEDAVTGQKFEYTLTSRQIVIKGDVTTFECPDNAITAIDFEGQPLLTYFDCSKNSIESLDLSGARELKTVYAQQNKLKKLLVEGCNGLIRLDCYLNNLKGLAMKKFMNSLPESTAAPYLFVIDTKSDDEGNVATTNDVAIATAKGWKVYDYNAGANYGMGVLYAGSEPSDTPDEYFSVTLAEKDHVMISVKFADPEYVPVIEGGSISQSNEQSILVNMDSETVTVYGDAVELKLLFASLTAIDVTNLPNLVELNVALNDIKELDLTGNPKLESLSCEGNLIEELDFSECPAIDYINCYGNQIKGENMTAMMKSLPARTRDEFGKLIIRDTSYQYEGNVALKTDVDVARAKYWAVYELLSDEDDDLHLYDGEDSAGIENITVDSNDAPVYYDLNGRPVANPANGIFIVRRGNEASKVIID